MSENQSNKAINIIKIMLSQILSFQKKMVGERTFCIKQYKSNRKAMNRNWSNQKSNPALKTKAGNNKYYK